MNREGYYATVPVATAVARAKMELGLETTNSWDFLFATWGEEAARKLDSVETIIQRVKCIDFVCGRADLPCGFYQWGGLALSGVAQIYYSQQWVRDKDCDCADCDTNNFINGDNTIQIVDGILDLGWNYTGSGEIWFKGLNVDDDGHMKIREEEVLAVVYWICTCYFSRKGNTIRKAEFNQQWIAQKQWVKGTAIKLRAKRDWTEIINLRHDRMTFGRWLQEMQARYYASINVTG